MDSPVDGPMVFMPDMDRNIFEPELVLSYMERDRGDPVYDELPERVRAAVARAEARALASAAPAPKPRGFLGALKSLLPRFFR